jgi:hypothetical protein
MRKIGSIDGVWRVLSTSYAPFIRYIKKKPEVNIQPAAFNADLVPRSIILSSAAAFSQSGGDLSVKSHWENEKKRGQTFVVCLVMELCNSLVLLFIARPQVFLYVVHSCV